jgi:UDP-N-acetylglucosamine/UDP-N-acetylgalactosamine diphosphorylase
VHFFQQGALPCIADEGLKFIMDSPHELATAPDGNGGIYAALHVNGMIEHMERNRVK